MEALKLRIGEEVFEIDLLSSTSPNTVRFLNNFLPFRFELHYAKIAGEEIFGMMPFYAPIEEAIDVAQVTKGMVGYWPHRQFLCFYYGKLQQETTRINCLGYIKGNLESFRRIGEKVRRNQGKHLFHGELYTIIPNGSVQFPIPKYHFLDDYEKLIWNKIPEEIRMMKKSFGIMRPGGIILYAESDTRVLHEFSSVILEEISKEKKDFKLFKKILIEFLSFFYNKTLGWYELKETARIIKKYHTFFMRCEKKENFINTLKSFVLFIGRINMWLDTLIPWNDINECFLSLK